MAPLEDGSVTLDQEGSLKSSNEGGNGPGGAPGPGLKRKKSRNRLPASCVQCRTKKLRCNRAAPCDQCTTRGQAETCDWTGAIPLYKAAPPEGSDTKALRGEVARLESLVRFLVDRPTADSNPSPESNSLSLDTVGPRISSIPGAEASDNTNRSSEASAASTSSSPPPSASAFSTRFPRTNFRAGSRPHRTSNAPPPLKDLRATDLCAALSQLAVRDFLNLEQLGNDAVLPGGATGDNFLNQAQGFLDVAASSAKANEQFLPVPSKPRGKLSTAFLGGFESSKATRMEQCLAQFPSPQQANSAVAYYFQHSNWFTVLLHEPSFYRDWDILETALSLEGADRVEAINPFFMSTFFGVIAIGLSMMSLEQAIHEGFGEDKDGLVDIWLEEAMGALQTANFMDNPSCESVRAVFLLAVYYVSMSNGVCSEAGIKLFVLSAQVVMSLGLHRDPDYTPGKYTFLEAEMRRRLFWSIFWICILSSALLGRTWSMFDMSGIDMAIPRDCFDHEIMDEQLAEAGLAERRISGGDTPMTSVILKVRLALLSKKINDRAFGIHAVSYQAVLELDAELENFELSLPNQYKFVYDSAGRIIRGDNGVQSSLTEIRACMIHMLLSSEYIRIHRPWLVVEGGGELYHYSRDQSVKYSKSVLSIYRLPFCVEFPWGSLSWRAVNASVIIGVEMMKLGEASEIEPLRLMIESTATAMERHFRDKVNICTRGARVLRFVLNKQVTMARERERLFLANKNLSTEAFASEWAAHVRQSFRTTNEQQLPSPAVSELRHKAPTTSMPPASTTNAPGSFSMPAAEQPYRGLPPRDPRPRAQLPTPLLSPAIVPPPFMVTPGGENAGVPNGSVNLNYLNSNSPEGSFNGPTPPYHQIQPESQQPEHFHPPYPRRISISQPLPPPPPTFIRQTSYDVSSDYSRYATTLPTPPLDQHSVPPSPSPALPLVMQRPIEYADAPIAVARPTSYHEFQQQGIESLMPPPLLPLPSQIPFPSHPTHHQPQQRLQQQQYLPYLSPTYTQQPSPPLPPQLEHPGSYYNQQQPEPVMIHYRTNAYPLSVVGTGDPYANGRDPFESFGLNQGENSLLESAYYFAADPSY